MPLSFCICKAEGWGIISALPKHPLQKPLLGNHQVAKKNFKLPKLLSDLVLIFVVTEVSLQRAIPLCFSV